MSNNSFLCKIQHESVRIQSNRLIYFIIWGAFSDSKRPKCKLEKYHLKSERISSLLVYFSCFI